MDKKKLISENSFEGAPAGWGGVSNYGGTYGTPSGGNITQSPSKFSSSDKTVNHMNNEATGSISTDDAGEEIENKVSKPNHIAPFDKAEKQKSETPLNPENEFNKDVNQLFSKKNTPSPDDIMSALQYELSQMVKKDKAIAKKSVLDNLKKDPQYYSRLHMLNIDDDEMKVDESTSPQGKIYKDRQGGSDVYWIDDRDSGGKILVKPEKIHKYLGKGYTLIDLNKSPEDNEMSENTKKSTVEKTKNVLDEMIASKKKQVTNKPEFDAIFQDLWKRRYGYNRSVENGD